MENFDDISIRDNIIIRGAKTHNLKNISLTIPRNKLTVITGLSGSGKSSLAFDTLYAQGRYKYIESLSSYARQFLGKLDKPDVEYIKGMSPAIAIEQKVNTSNPRSTVGTSSEVYDYIKLLFASIGKTYSPISGKQVKKEDIKDVLRWIENQNEGDRVLLLIKIVIYEGQEIRDILNKYFNQGYIRVEIDGKVLGIQEAIERENIRDSDISIVIDRWVIKHENSFYNRASDSIETAFSQGEGHCIVQNLSSGENISFSNKFELDGLTFEKPTVNTFNFNSPIGACPKCQGYGSIIDVDENLVIPNKNLSVLQGAVAPWSGIKLSKHLDNFISGAYNKFPITLPYKDLTKDQKMFLWEGDGKRLKGINSFFDKLKAKNYIIQNRVLLSRYRKKIVCNSCNGTRLKTDSSNIKIASKSIGEITLMPISTLRDFFLKLELSHVDKQISNRILVEINNRLNVLTEVGLGYLTLNRNSNSLSGGESQRIRLSASIGSSLVDSVYVLDEPSIGLHSKNTENLIKVLKKLRDIGNTVVVVEHDEDVIRQADNIIDIGPLAGINGGEIVFNGPFDQLENSDSITAKYISNKLKISTPKIRRPFKKHILITGARDNNLKDIDVRFPLNTLTVITGVSGSGKSSLIKNVLYNALKRQADNNTTDVGLFDSISGDLSEVEEIELVDQNPIGKSSRSNPVTYIGAYDEIRLLFSAQSLSLKRKYKPYHFSFNLDGGRCDECKGKGEVTVNMQFMSDINLVCESCNGSRFKSEILDVKLNDKNIVDLLNMSIDEAIVFFNDIGQVKISSLLEPLKQTGMGYVKLGQSSSSLSGGESQRVKLAYFLSKGNKAKKTVFIFDEPTTGLHFHDVKKLIKAFNDLIDNGHSIFVVEHNLDVIKSADWIIDMGKEGGKNGGNIIFQGTPEDMIKDEYSYTAKYLKQKISL
ncbi:excinuclease ABC subunit UvrA [Ichthyobacterium seriolicida]|uniref:UvrABC system protein A n=1 Tax=Ichthyobacterium seriolicida TaxID=242600 RepID=A0A1J1DW30_9FLAO|nr:excinuclease ABC subunit UvrA [Ichthyobacterium seriolicida]BAV94071.1 excinuclease ABC subunit A [Ichthyobacterium seriolicida]